MNSLKVNGSGRFYDAEDFIMIDFVNADHTVHMPTMYLSNE